MSDIEDIKVRIAEVERRIAELRTRLPKHSVPTAMALELDDLEYELQRLCRQRDIAQDSGKKP